MGRIPAFPLGSDNIPQPIPVHFPQFSTRKPRFPNRRHPQRQLRARQVPGGAAPGRAAGIPDPQRCRGTPGAGNNAAHPGSIPSPSRRRRCPGKLPLPPAQRAASPQQRAGCGRRCAGAAPAQRPPGGVRCKNNY